MNYGTHGELCGMNGNRDEGGGGDGGWRRGKKGSRSICRREA